MSSDYHRTIHIFRQSDTPRREKGWMMKGFVRIYCDNYDNWKVFEVASYIFSLTMTTFHLSNKIHFISNEPAFHSIRIVYSGVIIISITATLVGFSTKAPKTTDINIQQKYNNKMSNGQTYINYQRRTTPRRWKKEKRRYTLIRRIRYRSWWIAVLILI